MYLVNYLSPQTVNQQFIATARFRTGIELVGAKDGANVEFRIPYGDRFTHNLPFLSIAVFLNGVRLKLIDDYLIQESGGPGTGYDTVILEVVPKSLDNLLADYVAVGSP